MSKIAWGIVLAVYTTVSMMAVTVKDNRQFARDEIKELRAINKQNTRFCDPQNSEEMVEKWKEDKIKEKRDYLGLPFYKQLRSPPIHCVVELHSPLERA